MSEELDAWLSKEQQDKLRRLGATLDYAGGPPGCIIYPLYLADQIETVIEGGNNARQTK